LSKYYGSYARKSPIAAMNYTMCAWISYDIFWMKKEIKLVQLFFQFLLIFWKKLKTLSPFIGLKYSDWRQRAPPPSLSKFRLCKWTCNHNPRLFCRKKFNTWEMKTDSFSYLFDSYFGKKNAGSGILKLSFFRK